MKTRWLCGVAAVLMTACATASEGRDAPGDEPADDPIEDSSGEGESESPPVCGNGVLESGETCNPCTAQCAPRSCQTPRLVGAADACDLTCEYDDITACRGGDGCCAAGCDATTDTDCEGVRLDTFYEGDLYELEDLGAPPGVPQPLGALVIERGDPGRILVGGNANNDQGALYAVEILRDETGRIVGFLDEAERIMDAAYNDGGIVYDDEGLLLLARWPVNELGQTLPGSEGTDRIIPLDPLGVVSSIAGITIVPQQNPGAGQFKSVSWPGGEWYTLDVVLDAHGTYEVTAARPSVSLEGGPEGMVYVPEGSPLFDAPSVLVSEFQAGKVVTYEVDETGDPVVSTRRQFIIGLNGAEGATIDADSGDFLFSTWGTDQDHVVVVHGFSPIL